MHGHTTVPEKPLKAHVVFMVDYLTKAAEFAMIYDKSPAAVAKAFYYTWICRYFVPSHVTRTMALSLTLTFLTCWHVWASHTFTLVLVHAAHPLAMVLWSVL